MLALDESLAPMLIVAPCYTGPPRTPRSCGCCGPRRDSSSDGVREHSFLAQQHIFDSAYGEDRNYWKGHFVRELPDELIDELLRRMAALGRPPGQMLIESLHGAPEGRRYVTGAVGFRHAAFNVNAMANWQEPRSTSNTWPGRGTRRLRSSPGR